MILMYHHIAPPAGRSQAQLRIDPSGSRFTVTADSLRFHLQFLRDRGFSFISLADLIVRLRTEGSEPADALAVTFDDGWIDQFEYGLPILRELGCPATFFVTTQHLLSGSADPFRMDLDQLRELLGENMTIGAHSRSHPDLTRLDAGELMEEVVGSKADLESLLDIPIRLFAYPGGAFDRRVVDAVQCAGFEAACSILGPLANDRSSLFWLYRDTLTDGLGSPRDLYRLSPVARHLFAFRVRRRLRKQLQTGSGPVV